MSNFKIYVPNTVVPDAAPAHITMTDEPYNLSMAEINSGEIIIDVSTKQDLNFPTAADLARGKITGYVYKVHIVNDGGQTTTGDVQLATKNHSDFYIKISSDGTSYTTSVTDHDPFAA